jgi:hypothetical protein
MPAYGTVLMQANAEQVLRNIVQIHYGEPPSFLKITSITSSYALTSNVSGTAGWAQTMGDGSSSSVTQSLGLTGGTTFSDAPTISYVPIDDASFVTMLDQPIGFAHVAVLYNSEANYLEVLCKLVFAAIGQLDNASSASTAMVEVSPEYNDYKVFIHTLAKMVRNREAFINLVTYENEPGITIHLSKAYANSPDAQLLKKLLNDPLKYNDLILLSNPPKTLSKSTDGGFTINTSLSNKDNNLTYVRMRSISGMLAFLSHSVQTPESDRLKHYVPEYLDSSGNPINWNKILDDVMTIYTSDSEPKDAFIKARVHEHWFYIKRSDSNSKYSFAMLMKLMTLALGYSAPPGQSAPVITIPAGASKG